MNLLLPIAAHAAEPRFYVCEMNVDPDRLGWISGEVGLVFDGKGGVTVIDGIILYFNKKPVQGRLSGAGGKWRIGWAVKNVLDTKGHRIASMGYVANFDERTGRLSVRARPSKAWQSFSGRGSCVRRKAKQ